MTTRKKRKISYNIGLNQKNSKLMNWLNLAANCGYNGYKIKELSKENGNCLFESILLSSDKFESDKTIAFRKNIAHVLKKYKNENYLDKMDGSLEQVFNEFNEIPGYKYDDMVHDLSINGCWENFNTHLILNVMSKYYKLNFTIINNSSIVPIKISTHNEKEYKDIYLGHLLENHYVPLEKIENILL